MSKKKLTPIRLANIVQDLLIDKGFVVQRYDAYKTNSVYLKLDYGVANSIRFSNHVGKQHLRYRYNIGPHIENYTETEDTYPRYYYPASQYKQMVHDIVSAKNAKIGLYGSDHYKYSMERYYLEGQSKKGFWQQAYTVTKKNTENKSNESKQQSDQSTQNPAS